MDAEVAFNDRVLDEDLGLLRTIDSPTLDLDADAVVHVSADRASTAYRRLLRELVSGVDHRARPGAGATRPGPGSADRARSVPVSS